MTEKDKHEFFNSKRKFSYRTTTYSTGSVHHIFDLERPSIYDPTNEVVYTWTLQRLVVSGRGISIMHFTRRDGESQWLNSENISFCIDLTPGEMELVKKVM